MKKIKINDYFEYVAGHNTFEYCKPDPRHLTSVIEILGGDIKKCLMIGDSETDANAAKGSIYSSDFIRKWIYRKKY